MGLVVSEENRCCIVTSVVKCCYCCIGVKAKDIRVSEVKVVLLHLETRNVSEKKRIGYCIGKTLVLTIKVSVVRISTIALERRIGITISEKKELHLRCRWKNWHYCIGESLELSYRRKKSVFLYLGKKKFQYFMENKQNWYYYIRTGIIVNGKVSHILVTEAKSGMSATGKILAFLYRVKRKKEKNLVIIRRKKV